MNTYLDEIKPIEKFVLIDQIIEKLVKLIENGDLNPGDYLPGERILSEKLGVSRTSLRQALKALNVIGVLDIGPGKKTYIKDSFSDMLVNSFKIIKSVHSVEISKLFEARRVIEEGLVQIAAVKTKKEHIHKIESCLQHSEENINNKNEFNYSEAKFHNAILDIADNKILSAVINSLSEFLQVIEKYDNDYPNVEDRRLSLIQHKEIYEALKHNNTEKARNATHKHLQSVETRLKRKSKKS